MKKLLIVGAIVLAWLPAFNQGTQKALFLGNSYTYVNDLPTLLKALALSAGDVLTSEQSTPGGHTFQGHTNNATSLNFLGTPGFDFLILQEQSQLPSFPQSQVQQDVYPYATMLDTLFHNANPCGQTVFFMTWGRKNGDASNCQFWPPVCTYSGMQAELRRSYLNMAQQNNAIVAPVGEAWREAMLRNTSIELYNADQSHPALTGSYLAACVFYATMYRQTPLGLNYYAGLDSLTATFLQQVADDVVFDSLEVWRIGLDDLMADFSVSSVNANATFQDLSSNASSWHWDFGDGNSSSAQNPQHAYASAGTYSVTLTVSDGCDTLSVQDSVQIVVVGLEGKTPLELALWPVPSAGKLHLQGLWSGKGTLGLELWDLQGRKVWADAIEPGAAQVDHELDLGELGKGTYLFRGISEEGIFQQRVVLQ